tara:strand:- start:591 stop:1100 length:510 start_codon:yes stop_codon:yes gene_type:complete
MLYTSSAFTCAPSNIVPFTVKRFATFETSSHFKFFDDFASKASISSDVVVGVALLLVVVVLRCFLRVLVLLFVFLHAVINAAQHEEADFFVVERVVAVVNVVVAMTVVVTMKRSCDETAFLLNNGKSLSLLVIHKQKESAEKERDGEKAAAAAESYIMSLVIEMCESDF